MANPRSARFRQTLDDPATPMQKRLILALTCVLLLAGCSGLRFPGVYRIDVEQGNIVTDAMLAQLKPGMTEAQVRYVMGTPQIVDPFEAGRQVYLYRLRRGNGDVVEARVVVWFENGALARWEGNAVPPEARSRINTNAGAAGGSQPAPPAGP